MKKLTIIVPSRGRPHLMERLLESWKRTTLGHSRIVMVLDGDDSYHYNEVHNKYVGTAVELAVIFGERRLLTSKLNCFAGDWKEEGSIGVGFMGDDCVFISENWELPIIEWLEKNVGICYGNDLLQGESLPNNVFIHTDIIDALGFMAPPELKHYYIDNYWKDLGLRLDKLKYFPNIIIEHRHWSNKKEVKDTIYTEAEKLMGEDKITWDEKREEILSSSVKKIQDYE